MGWLAAGCCTVIAGVILYRFLVPRHTEDRSGEEVNLQLSQAYEPPMKAAHAIPSPSQTSSTELSPTPPTTQPVLLTPMETSQASKEPNTVEVKSPPTKTQEAGPQIIMLPPPKLDRSSSPPRLNPPRVGNASTPPRPGNGFIRPPPSAAASLRVPITKPLPNASLAPTSSIMPPGKQVSRKVILEPGHSPLDWAALTNDPSSRLRGKDAPGQNLLRVTPARLKKQNGRKGNDSWTAYQGKVYNISPYVPFHPGGAGEILRGAGKDSVKLFMEVHPWVNWDGMLSECLVGILVSEEEGANLTNGGLDEMD